MNNKTNKLIPELRFPEFGNDKEWRKEKLANISDVMMGSSPSSLSYNENKVGLPLLQGNADIKNRFSSPRIYTSVITKECEIDDILLSVRAPVGTVAKSLHKACIGRGISALRTIKPNSQEYLYQWLFSNESSWEKISQGGTFDAVNSDDIRNLLLPIPNPIEQKKIADCLSSLDELITAHTNKLETLKTYKKGLMQNLFPQDGEKVPKLRFKEFEKDGEWAERVVTDVANYENGKAHEKDITESGKYIVVNSKFISTDGEVIKYTNKAFCLAHKNDILMVLSDVPNGRAIAKCFYVDKDDFYSVNQRICKISPFNIDNKFLMYLLNRNKFFLSFDDGVKQTNLRNEDVQNCPLIVPNNPSEQQKIAETLSSLDNLIKEQSNKIEQLKSHKKGLMQGLFPKVNN